MAIVNERELFIWEKNHIQVCNDLNLFEGKDVLEVGGNTPESITTNLKVKSWTCVDLWNGVGVENKNYKILNADITTLNLPDKSYDFIFSTNAFEHIHNLDIGLKNMRRLLRPNGYLSALFGPIWSSSKGHHLWVTDEKGDLYNFNDGTIKHWGQLLYSKEEMRTFLKKNFSEAIRNYVIENIYETKILNHLFYEDYLNMVKNLGLDILEFRDWHSPIVPDEETLNLLKSKWGDRNFSTISIKLLLKAKA